MSESRLESCTGMGITVFPRNRGKSAVMGTEFTVVPWGWEQTYGTSVGIETVATVVPAVLQIAELQNKL